MGSSSTPSPSTSTADASTPPAPTRCGAHSRTPRSSSERSSWYRQRSRSSAWDRKFDPGLANRGSIGPPAASPASVLAQYLPPTGFAWLPISDWGSAHRPNGPESGLLRTNVWSSTRIAVPPGQDRDHRRRPADRGVGHEHSFFKDTEMNVLAAIRSLVARDPAAALKAVTHAAKTPKSDIPRSHCSSEHPSATSLRLHLPFDDHIGWESRGRE